jgi:hypothetical protein
MHLVCALWLVDLIKLETKFKAELEAKVELDFV